MKVVVVAACPFPFPRGTPIRIARLSEALARRGHDTHVVTYHLGEGSTADGVRVSRIPSVPLYRRTSPGPGYAKLLVLDPLLVRAVRRTLRRERPDIIYAHHYEGLLAAFIARGRRPIPLVYDAHTTLSSELPHSRMLPGRGLKRALGSLLDRRLTPLADAITCVNGELRSEIAGWSTRRPIPIVTIEGGVELEAFGNPEDDRQDERADHRTLVFAGNLAAYQGIEHMLEAFALVAEQKPGVRLLVVTSSERSLGRYEAIAKTLGVQGRIDRVTAPFRELPALLARADVALHPRPPCAGTPLKLLNYMAAGLPIVSFEGSAKGLTNGESASLVPDGDIEAFANATLRLLDDPDGRRTLGMRARRLAEERYSWDASAKVLEGVFATLAPR